MCKEEKDANPVPAEAKAATDPQPQAKLSDPRQQQLLEEFDKLYQHQSSLDLDVSEVRKKVRKELNRKRSATQKVRNCLCSGLYASSQIVLVGFILYVLLFGAVSLVLQSRNAEHFLSKNLMHLDYPVKRFIRVWTLPFKQFCGPLLNNVHESSCLIRNPIYSDHDINCDDCHNNHKIVEQASREDFDLSSTYPVKMKNSEEMKYEDLLAVMKKKGVWGTTLKALECSDSRLSSVDDVASNVTSGQFLTMTSLGHFYCQWTSNGVGSAQVLRRLHGRPSFVPDGAEVSLLKTVYISGHRRGETLAEGQYTMQWYLQAHGSRTVLLEPTGCQQECTTMGAVLAPGDILYYNRYVYKAKLAPSNEQTYFIGIQGSYLP